MCKFLPKRPNNVKYRKQKDGFAKRSKQSVTWCNFVTPQMMRVPALLGQFKIELLPVMIKK